MELDRVAVSQLFSTSSAAWTAVLILALFVARLWSGAPAILDKWLAWRAAKAAERTAYWDRLLAEIRRLDERCDHLQVEVDACREREGEWMRRAIAAEAYHIGEGEALQTAQRIVSIERQIDADKKGKPE
jgi:hypothetical protein